MSNKYVVIDLETTGNSPKKGDKIIQFAAVVIQNGCVIEEYSSLVYPEQPIPAFIEELTGLSDEMVKDSPLFADIAPKVVKLLKDAYFVAHNVLFDLTFLQEELIMAGFEGFHGPVLDTVEMARILMPGSDSFTLSDLAVQEGLSHDRPHQADSDAYVTGELLLILFKRLHRLPLATIRQLHKLSYSLKSDLDEILAEIMLQKQKSLEELPDQLEQFRGITLKKEQRNISRDGEKEMIYPAGDRDKEMLLKKVFPFYEKRSGQFRMMDLVHDTFQQEHHSMIEAGTGVGKSIAYLFPALIEAVRSRKPVVISTFTTQLQEQLLTKDIPLLQKMVEFPFHTVLLKGKNHYISLEKFERTLREPENNYDTALTKMQLLVWLTETSTGDRDELHLSSGGQMYWNKVKHDVTDQMTNHAWSSREFYNRMKRDAQSAHLIITNHSFLLSDLIAERGILPEFDCLIIDEGHHFEKTSRKFLGQKLDYAHVRYFLQHMGLYEQKQMAYRMVQTMEKFCIEAEAGTQYAAWNKIMADLSFEMDELFKVVSFIVKKHIKNKHNGWVNCRLDNRQTRELNMLTAAAERFLFLLKEYNKAMSDWYEMMQQKGGKQNEKLNMLLSELVSWMNEGEKIMQSIREILLQPLGEHVHWIEMDTRAMQNKTTIYAQPVSVSSQLNKLVFQKKKSVVVTSATMTVKGNFTYMLNELGLEPSQVYLEQITSPFRYDKQVQFVISNDLPEVNSVSLAEYAAAIGEHIISIAEATKGRMLILFTSYEMLRKTYELLKESGFLHEYTMLAQGITSGSRTRLTRNFLRFEKAILLGTNSFWEGIDIPGEDLSCLIMVRLPFSPPDEPHTEAKCLEVKEKGGNPFYDYSLPEAVIRFKQGFGRLIRTSTDKGLMVVFDRRVISTRYGKAFLDSIPSVKAQEMNIDQLTDLIKRWL
ncbi:ATP-dependent DNA helicase DinG [Bacillus benzoevorans]|uniref:3'-5' exonuclease DinG n=1 Tax=Bacillus benzoevorans TaxID=1456 RepID=A0A7X0LUL5_9BACI|nr:ATP-dependent DNA helicase DinG [Bacillus benzoevorans]MBB6444673.1 ATP-dependent DNA helicase DinG [Bacillus benzoevorans]